VPRTSHSRAGDRARDRPRDRARPGCEVRVAQAATGQHTSVEWARRSSSSPSGK
jgi:hypothetical protein